MSLRLTNDGASKNAIPSFGLEDFLFKTDAKTKSVQDVSCGQKLLGDELH